MSTTNLGRHRVPGRLNTASNLSAAVSRAAKPATKASAVLAVSGGMAASFALPASAAPAAPEAKTKEPATNAALATLAVAQAPRVARIFGQIAFTGIVKPDKVAAPVAAPVSHERARATDRVSRSDTRKTVRSVAIKKFTASDVAPSSSGLLDIAASLSGIDYVYGGTTTAGFDCSGYTQYVFAKVGIHLPRVAEAQRQATTRISRAAAKPGDLVFFGAPAHHMGIYAGNGMMWDSPRTGKAVSLRPVYSSSATFGRV